MAEDLGDDWWVKDVNKDSVSNNENPGQSLEIPALILKGYKMK